MSYQPLYYDFNTNGGFFFPNERSKKLVFVGKISVNFLNTSFETIVNNIFDMLQMDPSWEKLEKLTSTVQILYYISPYCKIFKHIFVNLTSLTPCKCISFFSILAVPIQFQEVISNGFIQKSYKTSNFSWKISCCSPMNRKKKQQRIQNKK